MASIAAKRACAWHPEVAARFWCSSCLAPICTSCAVSQANGAVRCPRCAAQAGAPATPAATAAPPEAAAQPYSLAPAAAAPRAMSAPPPMASAIPYARPASHAGNAAYPTARPAQLPSPQAYGYGQAPNAAPVMCAGHSAVYAAVRCLRCASPICQTCDFVFPGNVHLCPRCATTRPTEMSGGRKAMTIWSLCLAGFAILMILVAVTGAYLTLLLALPAVSVGTGLSFGAYEKRAGNSVLVWIAMAINGAFTVLFTIVVIAGMIIKMNSRI